MDLNDLSKSLSLKLICGDPDRSFEGVYAGDLLSRAMSHVKADNLWITIMANVNVIAVASLSDCAAVILAEDVMLLDDALEAAKKKEITVFQSSSSVYDLCVQIAALTNRS